MALKRTRATAAEHAARAKELMAAGRFEEAAQVLAGALQRDPGLFEAHLLRGRALEQATRPKEAIASYRRALSLKPDSAEAFLQLGTLCARLGALVEAEFMLKKALEIQSGMIEAYHALGLVLGRREKFEDAETLLRKALFRAPDGAELHAALGSTLAETGRLREALPHFAEAVRLNPDFGEAHAGLGNVLRDLGRPEEALAAYDRTLELIPDDARAHVSRAAALLLTGDYAGGWREYEWRLKLPEARDVSGLPRRWRGETLRNRTILVYTEQGVDDGIMFAALLSDLIGTGARVVLWSTGRLAALLARSFPDAEVHVAPEEDGREFSFAGIDYSVAMGSLPLFFRQAKTDFTGTPRHARYLVPDAGAVQEWRRRCDGLGEGLKVGISWRGGASARDTRLRTTGLDDWSDLFELPDIAWINLQIGEPGQEIAAFEEKSGRKVHDWPNAAADLDDFAARIDALDLVISIDNSTAHLAGALAKPLWTLVPFVATWRWGGRGETTPWYPSMRLVRQHEDQPWRGVLAPLAHDLVAAFA